MEKLDAEVILERAHMRRHRGLADIQRLRGGGEAAGAGDCMERFKPSLMHR
jgi:hypothetical protein